LRENIKGQVLPFVLSVLSLAVNVSRAARRDCAWMHLKFPPKKSEHLNSGLSDNGQTKKNRLKLPVKEQSFVGEKRGRVSVLV